MDVADLLHEVRGHACSQVVSYVLDEIKTQ